MADIPWTLPHCFQLGRRTTGQSGLNRYHREHQDSLSGCSQFQFADPRHRADMDLAGERKPTSLRASFWEPLCVYSGILEGVGTVVLWWTADLEGRVVGILRASRS